MVDVTIGEVMVSPTVNGDRWAVRQLVIGSNSGRTVSKSDEADAAGVSGGPRITSVIGVSWFRTGEVTLESVAAIFVSSDI